MIEICMPLANGVEPHESVEADVVTLLNFSGLPVTTQGPIHHSSVLEARNLLVQRANGDHLLFIDGDVTSADPVGDLKRMLSAEVPIIGGAYKMRGGDHYCAVKREGNCERYFEKDEKGVHRASWVGAGWLLLDRNEIAKRLPANEPWFRHEWIETADGQRLQTPEDVGFCMHARAHGVDVYVDLNTHLTHITETPKKKDEKMEREEKQQREQSQQSIIQMSEWKSAVLSTITQVSSSVLWIADQFASLDAECKRRGAMILKLKEENERLKGRIAAAEKEATTDEPAQ